jgi:hypothetical protein
MKQENHLKQTAPTSPQSGASTQESTTRTPEAQTARIKAELAKYDVPPIQEVELTDPITGKKSLVSLDRTGHSETKLIQALADPNLTRDRKDHELSMYLYERGAHNTSMIVDLMRYKGMHSKESQIFKSQIRFDFQTFANSFVAYLHNQSRLLGITLGVDIAEEKSKFQEWLSLPNNKGKGYTYAAYWESGKRMILSEERRPMAALIEMAIMALDEAQLLQNAIENIVKARDAARGGGIYIDRMGRPYDLNDPMLEDVMKAEREIIAEAEKDNDR